MWIDPKRGWSLHHSYIDKESKTGGNAVTSLLTVNFHNWYRHVVEYSLKRVWRNIVYLWSTDLNILSDRLGICKVSLVSSVQAMLAFHDSVILCDAMTHPFSKKLIKLAIASRSRQWIANQRQFHRYAQIFHTNEVYFSLKLIRDSTTILST